MSPLAPLLPAAIAVLVLLSGSAARAAVIGGVEFPMGALSFADAVLTYDPLFTGGPGPTEPNSINPASALGVPDFPAGGIACDPRAVSLGRGGRIELLFVDNLLTNSGSSARDLHVFEVGPEVEDTFVAIRPLPETALLLGNPSLFDTDSDGFYEIGKVFGRLRQSTSTRSSQVSRRAH